MKAIFERRSIRRYTAQPVTDEQIRHLLRAGMSAPSAQNERPWQFLVVTDRERLRQLARVSPYTGMTKDAAVAIVVCGDLTRELASGFWVQDCAAATENILLAVTVSGLGAVWLGIYPVEERVQAIKDMFALPEPIIPFAVIPVGHPADAPDAPDRYEAARVHYEQW
jgi:nitroreductase